MKHEEIKNQIDRDLDLETIASFKQIVPDIASPYTAALFLDTSDRTIYRMLKSDFVFRLHLANPTKYARINTFIKYCRLTEDMARELIRKYNVDTVNPIARAYVYNPEIVEILENKRLTNAGKFRKIVMCALRKWARHLEDKKNG